MKQTLKFVIITILSFWPGILPANQSVAKLDWSKLEGTVANDELADICSFAIKNTQNGLGKLWLDKVLSIKKDGDFLDFGVAPPRKNKKGKLKSSRREMEDAIRPITVLSRTLVLAMRTGNYHAERAGVEATEIKQRLPLVIRSLAKDHKINGGLGEQHWGDTWQSAMWAGALAQTAWMIWDELDDSTHKLVTNVLIHEANRYLKIPPPTSDSKSKEDTKAEENRWNANCLLTASAMLINHPNQQAWREQAIVYLLNAAATPYDLKSTMIVDGKPLSQRLRGYCVTKDYAVGNHHAYPHPGYTSTLINAQSAFLLTLASQMVPEALFYNTAPIYRMFVDHQWSKPPYRSPGGTVFKKGGSIYWPIEKEKERAGRYYLWTRLNITADIFGLDKNCSTKAAHWAKLHGQIMVDGLNGKETPVKMEAYHKGSFFNTSLYSYLLRSLHVKGHLAPVRVLSIADDPKTSAK